MDGQWAQARPSTFLACTLRAAVHHEKECVVGFESVEVHISLTLNASLNGEREELLARATRRLVQENLLHPSAATARATVTSTMVASKIACPPRALKPEVAEDRLAEQHDHSGLRFG